MAKNKWVMIVKKKGGDISKAWRENLSEDGKPLLLKTPIEEVRDHAQSIILYFNGTLRKGETARELVEVKKVDSKLLEGELEDDK